MAALGDAAWELVCPVPVPPAGVVRLDEPDRRVRDIVAHLLVIDEMILRGGALRTWSGMRHLEHPGAWDLRRIQPLAALPIPELVALLASRGERFGRIISAAPGPLRRVPVVGRHGRLSISALIGRRVLHEWLHEHDIATATGSLAPAPSALVSTVVADAALQLLPLEGLSRLGADRGVVRIVVDCTGGAGSSAVSRTWGIDFARRQYGPRVVASADATIRVTAPALALLANGRGDRLGEGRCAEMEGDTDLAAVLLEEWTRSAVRVPCLGDHRVAVA